MAASASPTATAEKRVDRALLHRHRADRAGWRVLHSRPCATAAQHPAATAGHRTVVTVGGDLATHRHRTQTATVPGMGNPGTSLPAWLPETHLKRRLSGSYLLPETPTLGRVAGLRRSAGVRGGARRLPTRPAHRTPVTDEASRTSFGEVAALEESLTGIDHLLTKIRSPTTTGKIERWHQSDH